jgi:hypothetical protein
MRKSSLSAIAGRTTRRLLLDAQRFISLGFRSRSQLAAENLFLRKQLALYAERGVRPCRADEDTRIALVVLARFFDWRAALTIVKPETLIPDTPPEKLARPSGHHIVAGLRVTAAPILAGLHHAYRLEPLAA